MNGTVAITVTAITVKIIRLQTAADSGSRFGLMAEPTHKLNCRASSLSLEDTLVQLFLSNVAPIVTLGRRA